MTVAESPPPASDDRLAYRGPIQRLLTRPDVGALIGAVSLWVFFWAVSDIFGTVAGASNFLDVTATYGIMAVAVAMLMIGGEFDLSAGAMTGTTAILLMLLVKPSGELGGAGLHLAIALPITFLFAIGIGWFNGTMVERTGLPSFIVTLGTFFVLKGAKLGFAKLFTSKVIVEGLDKADGYELFQPIFGATWIRNQHIFDGRDTVYGLLLILGAAALGLGLMELGHVRRDNSATGGLIGFVIGVGLTGLAVIRLLGTDSVTDNRRYGALVGIGLVVAALGWAKWRLQPFGDRGSLDLGPVGLRLSTGIGLLVLGGFVAKWLDSSSSEEVGFLLTVQGLRAIVFVGCSVAGISLIGLTARQVAETSPITRTVILGLLSLCLVALAFLIQSESQVAKFRAVLFAMVLLGAAATLVFGLIGVVATPKRSGSALSDRLGSWLTVGGLVAIVGALVLRLLFMTGNEAAATSGVTTLQSSIMWYILFAVVATWVLARTKFGSWTFAVGGNKKAAREVGVPAARTKTQLFMTVSASAWLAGMLLAFRINSIQASVGDGHEFYYIIAAVVGGCLLTGGYGSAAGAAFGALIIGMAVQGIPFSRWNTDWAFVFLGLILLLAVMVNNYIRAKAEAAR